MAKRKPKPKPTGAAPKAATTRKSNALTNPRVRAKILKAISAGLSVVDAATVCKISREAIYAYKRTHPEFVEQVKAAESSAEHIALEAIVAAMAKDWRAAAWFLERKFWQRWARRDPDAITPDILIAIISRVVSALMAEVPSQYHSPIQVRINAIISDITTIRELTHRQRKSRKEDGTLLSGAGGGE